MVFVNYIVLFQHADILHFQHANDIDNEQRLHFFQTMRSTMRSLVDAVKRKVRNQKTVG